MGARFAFEPPMNKHIFSLLPYPEETQNWVRISVDGRPPPLTNESPFDPRGSIEPVQEMREGSSLELGVLEKNMFSNLEISEFLGYTIYYLRSTSFY
jgi:hypothetical protein